MLDLLISEAEMEEALHGTPRGLVAAIGDHGRSCNAQSGVRPRLPI